MGQSHAAVPLLLSVNRDMVSAACHRTLLVTLLRTAQQETLRPSPLNAQGDNTLRDIANRGN
jgi:hypothetical protein